MRKRTGFMKLALALTLCFTLIAPFGTGVSAASEFTSRNDFSWGVNGHNQTYKSYPIRSLDQQIKLAAELGVGIYRFNYNPKNGNDYQYLDGVVGLVERYGMKLMLVLDDFGPDAEVLRNRCETIAKRYNGKNGHGTIPYIQVYNEVDVWAMTTKDFSDVGSRKEGDGTIAAHYSQMALADVLPKFKAGVAGVKAGNPNCKVVINISYMHTYLFDYLKENGVTWDLTGLDWYENMGAFSGILNRLTSRYSQDILICETNIWPFNASLESEYENNTVFLPSVMREVYNNYPRVKGLIFYELLDEPDYEMRAGRYEGESHFGLVKINKSNFSIGTKKPIYHRIQQMLGGGPREPAPIESTTSKPSATTTSKADGPTSTQDTVSKPSVVTTKPNVTTSRADEVTSDSVASSQATLSSETAASDNPSRVPSSTVPSNGTDRNDKEKAGFPIGGIVGISIAAICLIAIAIFLILKIKYGKFPGFMDGLNKKN